ncbi:unnamed protein product [marine sediment metagenome]|uniref:Uncharacterized protein n=1 Tax=marine sediment metagenome TaxID=412755 RepID=X1LEF0_9ZZZZ
MVSDLETRVHLFEHHDAAGEWIASAEPLLQQWSAQITKMQEEMAAFLLEQQRRTHIT